MGQKKKWSKGKVKDKAQHAVILDKATSDKLYKDVQSYRLITVATLVDRLKINGSLARRCLADLEEKGQIKKIVGHSKLQIYTRAVAATEMFGGFGGEGTDQEDCRTQQVADLHSCGRCCGIENFSFLFLRCHDQPPFFR